MTSDLDRNRAELTALWACLTTLRTLGSARERGEWLVAKLQEDKALAKYFRMAYDPTKHFGFTSEEDSTPVGTDTVLPVYLVLRQAVEDKEMPPEAGVALWLNATRGLQPELRAVANAVLDKDLGCGLSPAFVNKVFAKAGLPLMPENTVVTSADDYVVAKALKPTPMPVEQEREAAKAALTYEDFRAAARLVKGVVEKGAPVRLVLAPGQPADYALYKLMIDGLIVGELTLIRRYKDKAVHVLGLLGLGIYHTETGEDDDIPF